MGIKKISCFIVFLLSAIVTWAQQAATGRVLDAETGVPIAGASVIVKNTNIGTITDADGTFRLNVPAGTEALVVSGSGYPAREVSLAAGLSGLTISLSRNVQSLNEVVVVAYGQQERRKLTGSVGRVSGRQVENVPFPSVDQILQGRVAGLQSVAPSGQPGAAQQIRIRGIGSISASSEPLFVIDGIPVNSGDQSNLTQSSNLLASLNPNDIESISVLKDASAASIYGSRAANGVILITTKKGRSGKTIVRADAEFGTNEIAYLPDAGKPLNRDEVNELFREGLANAGFGSATINAIMNNTFGYSSNANTNWLDLVRRRGKQQQVNLSVSGGDEKTQFFLSGGFFQQESPIIGSDLKRYNSNLNLRHALNNRVSVGLSLNLSSFRQRGESEAASFRNPILAAMALLPSRAAFDDAGKAIFDPGIFNQIFNPVAIREYDKQNNQTSKLLGSANIEYRPIDNLRLTSRFGVDYNNIEEYQYWNPIFGDARTLNGYAANSYERLYNWVWTNFADYDFRALADKIDGTFTVGYESQESKSITQFNDGNVLPTNRNIVYPVPALPTTASITASDYAFTSVFSRAQLNLLDRYSISGSLRRDGSSRFGSENRYGTFWSVGAAWNIDREAFLQGQDVLSALKLRASYGVNGNAGIGNYNWRSTFLFSRTYNGVPASFQNTIGNSNLTWEQNKPFNVGLEVGILNNAVSLEADYYIRKTENLLLNEPLSATGGFTTYSNNVGAMENRGLELTLNATPVKGKDFSWTITANGAWNRNRVTRLRPGVDEVVGNPFTLKVGEDFQSYYIRQWAGADPETGDPRWYVDKTGKETTSTFSEAARVLKYSASPKGFGGISTSLTYKFVTLDAQLNYQYGNRIFNAWDFIFISDGDFLGLNHSRKQLQRWQKPGDITDVPRFEYGSGNSSNDVSTRYLYKGDFLRLRNATLSFTLPAALASRARLSSARIYVRGTNIWTKTFDDNLTVDPEQPIGGLTDLQFFAPKAYTVGLNLQL